MSRYAGRVVVDNPDAGGAIDVWGIGRDWLCTEPRLDGAGPGAITPDIDGGYGWIIPDTAEYIKGLGAIGPRGLAAIADMDLDEWTVETGSWRETVAFGGDQITWLHCHDAAATIAGGDYGYAQSNDDFEPALLIWIWHMPPAPWNTDPAFVDIVLVGDGEGASYALRLPRWQGAGGAIDGDARICRGPTLYGRLPGESTWSLVDEVHDEQISAERSHLTRPELRRVALEYDPGEGWLILTLDGMSEPHLFRGEWTANNGSRVPFALSAGPLGLRVVGHTALLNVQQLAYTTPVVMRPTTYLTVPSNMQATQSYRGLGSEPAGTDIAAAVETQGDYASRPVVTFTTTNSARRGLLRRVQEYRYPEFSAANSSPLSTEDGDTFQLLEMSGECTDTWRGARLEARIEAAPGETLAEVSLNQEVAAAVTADEGSNWTELFFGYVAEDPERSREDETGRETMRLTATDGIESRLSRRFMWGHPSYEYWPIDEAFEYILERAGVRGDQISVDSSLTGLRLPLGVGSERLLAFRNEERVETALDLIATVRGCEWGVDETGTYFLRPVSAHVAGAYDLAIDLDTSTAEDLVIAPFRHARDFGEFANMMAVTVGQGWNAAGGWFWDPDSIFEPTSPAYVGEDWWMVESFPDGDSVQRIYEALWARRLELSDVLYWHTLGHADTMPGDEVQFTNAGCGITDGSIFRITRKAWRLVGGLENGVYEAQYEGVLVEVGA